MAFWRKKSPQPPVVSCYGKLPATGDFVRLASTSAECAAFDEWLQGAVSLARQTLGGDFDHVYRPALGLFVYRGPEVDGEPERGMIGCWAASGDSAGRSYPMVVATCYDYEQMLAVGPGLPIAVWPFLTAAYDLVANGRGLGVDEFLGRVRELQPVALDSVEAARAPYETWLRGQRMGALWDTAFGAGANRHGIVHNVAASVEIFRGQERPPVGMAIRLPIGAGDAYAVSVWTDMTLRLAKWQRTLVNAFWTPRHDVLLHVGPPHVATFRELIAGTGEAEHVTDLVRPPNIDPQTARRRLGELGLGHLAPVVDNVDATIHAFLEAL